MSDPQRRDPLAGISDREQRIMGRLLHMPRQQQKDAPKPMSGQGIGQRRRREKERQRATGASGGD
jgi:hypothetical protein